MNALPTPPLVAGPLTTTPSVPQQQPAPTRSTPALSEAPAPSDRPAPPLYRVSLAVSQEDVRAAQRLRHQVFAGELGARLDGPEPGLDSDAFDAYCDHLLVREVASGDVIATYRLLPPERARIMRPSLRRERIRSRPARPDPRRSDRGRPLLRPPGPPGRRRHRPHLGGPRALHGAQRAQLAGSCCSIPLADGGVLAADSWDTVRTKYLAPEEYWVTPHRLWQPTVATRPTGAVGAMRRYHIAHRARRPPAAAPRLPAARCLGLRCARARPGLQRRRPLCTAVAAPHRPALSAPLPVTRSADMSVWLPTAPCTPHTCAGHTGPVRSRLLASALLVAGCVFVLVGVVCFPAVLLLGQAPRDRLIRWWAYGVVRAFGVRVRVIGLPQPSAGEARAGCTRRREPHLVAGHTACRRRAPRPDARQERDPALAGARHARRPRRHAVRRPRPAAGSAHDRARHRGGAARRFPGGGLPRRQHLVRARNRRPVPARRVPGRARRARRCPPGTYHLPHRVAGRAAWPTPPPSSGTIHSPPHCGAWSRRPD